MAKRKGTKNANEGIEPDQPQQLMETRAGKTEEGCQQDETKHEQDETSIGDLSVEQLREELQKSRLEIARLKAELASASCDRDTPLKGSKPQEVQDLQEKLQRLRNEQQEADAARDKAWKQLKAVVQEISSLANPDYLQSLQLKAQE